MGQYSGMRILFVSVIFLTVLSFMSQSIYAYRAGDLEITPTISMDERYDDNITSVAHDTLNDFITDLNVGVTVTGEGRDQKLDLTGAVGREMFADHKKFNNTTENLALIYHKELSSHDRINMSDGFTHAEVPTNFEDEFGRAKGRYSYYLNRFSTDYTRDITEQFSLTAGYFNETYNAEKGFTDSTKNALSLRGDYALSSAMILSVTYGYQLYHYSPGGNANAQTIDAGLRQYLTKQLYMDYSAGMAFVDPATGKRLSAPRYSVSLTDEFDEKTKAVLSYSKRYEPGYSSDDVFNSWRVNLEVSRRLQDRVALVAGVFFYGEGKYVRSGIKDKFNGTSLRLEYDLTKNTSAVLSFSRSQTNSSQDTRDYKRDVASLGLRIKF
jgi:hypothetical protein